MEEFNHRESLSSNPRLVFTWEGTRWRDRRDAGQGLWSTDLRQEFFNASRDLHAAGVPNKVRKKAIRKAYNHFYNK